METLQAVQAGVLSILITLSGLLNDGLKSFDAKKYDEAVVQFTKLIEKSEKETRFNDIAMFYRAKSYQALKKKDKAVIDLLALITKFPDSKYFADSRKFYKEWGGDMSKLLPGDSPTAVWKKFIKAAAAGDKKTALTFTTGMWEQMVSQQSGEEMQRNMMREQIVIGAETIGTGDDAGTATLTLGTKNQMAIPMQFKLSKENVWLIVGPDMEEARNAARGGMPRGRGTVIGNVNNLKQIGLACRMYSNSNNDEFPPTLDALKDDFLQQDSIYLWTNVKTGKKKPFVYAPGYNESDSVDTMIAAAPMAVNGKREVLWLDGHVKTISEEEFIKNAKAQKWRLKGLLKKEEVPKDKQKLAKELIAKLADDSFDVRKKAKADLIKMGDNAFPFLEDNKKHTDPEVRMTIKDIMEGK